MTLLNLELGIIHCLLGASTHRLRHIPCWKGLGFPFTPCLLPGSYDELVREQQTRHSRAPSGHLVESGASRESVPLLDFFPFVILLLLLSDWLLPGALP